MRDAAQALFPGTIRASLVAAAYEAGRNSAAAVSPTPLGEAPAQLSGAALSLEWLKQCGERPENLPTESTSMYVYGAVICLSTIIGAVIGVRCRAAADGVLAALASAAVISGFASLRYLEMALFWLFGSPAAGLELLGILCLIPAPWVLASRHRAWNLLLSISVIAAALLIGFLDSDFPFLPVYAAAVLSALTHFAATERLHRAAPGYVSA